MMIKNYIYLHYTIHIYIYRTIPQEKKLCRNIFNIQGGKITIFIFGLELVHNWFRPDIYLHKVLARDQCEKRLYLSPTLSTSMVTKYYHSFNMLLCKYQSPHLSLYRKYVYEQSRLYKAVFVYTSVRAVCARGP